MVYGSSWQSLPGRLAKWDRVVTLSNNRAVTIYLWHNTLIMATVPIIDLAYELPFLQSDTAVAALDAADPVLMFCLVWPLIGLAILTVGWIEDIGAGRGPRLWPDGGKRGGSPRRPLSACRRSAGSAMPMDFIAV